MNVFCITPGRNHGKMLDHLVQKSFVPLNEQFFHPNSLFFLNASNVKHHYCAMLRETATRPKAKSPTLQASVKF